jgi:hypothetical protein
MACPVICPLYAATWACSHIVDLPSASESTAAPSDERGAQCAPMNCAPAAVLRWDVIAQEVALRCELQQRMRSVRAAPEEFKTCVADVRANVGSTGVAPERHATATTAAHAAEPSSRSRVSTPERAGSCGGEAHIVETARTETDLADAGDTAAVGSRPPNDHLRGGREQPVAVKLEAAAGGFRAAGHAAKRTVRWRDAAGKGSLHLPTPQRVAVRAASAPSTSSSADALPAPVAERHAQVHHSRSERQRGLFASSSSEEEEEDDEQDGDEEEGGGLLAGVSSRSLSAGSSTLGSTGMQIRRDSGHSPDGCSPPPAAGGKSARLPATGRKRRQLSDVVVISGDEEKEEDDSVDDAFGFRDDSASNRSRSRQRDLPNCRAAAGVGAAAGVDAAAAGGRRASKRMRFADAEGTEDGDRNKDDADGLAGADSDSRGRSVSRHSIAASRLAVSGDAARRGLRSSVRRRSSLDPSDDDGAVAGSGHVGSTEARRQEAEAEGRGLGQGQGKHTSDMRGTQTRVKRGGSSAASHPGADAAAAAGAGAGPRSANDGTQLGWGGYARTGAPFGGSLLAGNAGGKRSAGTEAFSGADSSAAATKSRSVSQGAGQGASAGGRSLPGFAGDTARGSARTTGTGQAMVAGEGSDGEGGDEAGSSSRNPAGARGGVRRDLAAEARSRTAQALPGPPQPGAAVDDGTWAARARTGSAADSALTASTGTGAGNAGTTGVSSDAFIPQSNAVRMRLDAGAGAGTARPGVSGAASGKFDGGGGAPRRDELLSYVSEEGDEHGSDDAGGAGVQAHAAAGGGPAAAATAWHSRHDSLPAAPAQQKRGRPPAAPASTRQVMFGLGAAAGAADAWRGMARGTGKARGRPRSADAAGGAGSGRGTLHDKAATIRGGATLRLQRR